MVPFFYSVLSIHPRASVSSLSLCFILYITQGPYLWALVTYHCFPGSIYTKIIWKVGFLIFSQLLVWIWPLLIGKIGHIGRMGHALLNTLRNNPWVYRQPVKYAVYLPVKQSALRLAFDSIPLYPTIFHNIQLIFSICFFLFSTLFFSPANAFSKLLFLRFAASFNWQPDRPFGALLVIESAQWSGANSIMTITFSLWLFVMIFVTNVPLVAIDV